MRALWDTCVKPINTPAHQSREFVHVHAQTDDGGRQRVLHSPGTTLSTFSCHLKKGLRGEGTRKGDSLMRQSSTFFNLYFLFNFFSPLPFFLVCNSFLKFYRTVPREKKALATIQSFTYTAVAGCTPVTVYDCRYSRRVAIGERRDATVKRMECFALMT